EHQGISRALPLPSWWRGGSNFGQILITLHPLTSSPPAAGVKKFGRASLLANHRPSPGPLRLGGSLALPISAGFEFFPTKKPTRDPSQNNALNFPYLVLPRGV